MKSPVTYYDLAGKEIMSKGTGKAIAYFDNGKIAYEAIYKDGCRDGLAIWYYDNGQIEQAAIYKYSLPKSPNGLRWEIISSFNGDGTAREKGDLKNGSGTWILYDDTGKVSKINRYSNGVPID